MRGALGVTLQINNTTLSELIDSDKNKFVRIFTTYCDHTLRVARLDPVLSKARLYEVRGAWKNDLERVSSNERNLSEGLDHFKQCGHLAFWIRRFTPLIEFHDQTKNIGDSEGYPLSDYELKFRALLAGYGNEFLAFDFGFQIVKFYQSGLGSKRANFMPDQDYVETICHSLKYKAASPHSMHMLYRSLFAE
jgi:hypothetical protein